MENKGDVFWGRSLVVSAVMVLGLVGLVLAGHTVWVAGDTDGIYGVQPLEDITHFYNFSVNTTDAAGTLANITKVNVSLPSSFTFTDGFNYTSAKGNFTLDAGGNLIWENQTAFLVNGTGSDDVDAIQFFGFNATAANPGNYNISVYTYNATFVVGSNISVVINDTTAATAGALVAPGELVGVNVSKSSIEVNVSITDNGVVDALSIALYNSTGDIVNITNNTFSGNFAYQNFSNIANDGSYWVRLFNVNDTFNNRANLSVGNITLDRAVPTVTLAKSTSLTTRNTLVVDISASDVTTGIYGYCTADRAGDVTLVSGTESQLYTETGLSCGSTYSVSVTCYDYASHSTTETGSFATASCTSDGSSGGGSGGGGGNSPTDWDNTVREDDDELSSVGTVNRNLGALERVSVLIDGEEHHVGVVSLTSASAVIEVGSTPESSEFSVGETKKFEVTDDDYYDLAVTLVSITGDKANVEMSYIHELMPTTDDGTSGSGTSGSGASGSGSLSWLWWVIIAVIVVAVIVFIAMKKKKK